MAQGVVVGANATINHICSSWVVVGMQEWVQWLCKAEAYAIAVAETGREIISITQQQWGWHHFFHCSRKGERRA
jgi:hypothetical protein